MIKASHALKEKVNQRKLFKLKISTLHIRVKSKAIL